MTPAQDPSETAEPIPPALTTTADHRRAYAARLEGELGELREGLAERPEASRLGRARRLWKRLPVPGWARAGATRLLYALSAEARAQVAREAEARALREVLPWDPADIRPGPLVVSGFLSDVSGVGRAARMSVETLARMGFAVRPHDLRVNPQGWPYAGAGGVWLCHCNAPEAMDFLLQSRSAYGCYRIGYWAWELPELPRYWVEIADYFHEIWAPSRFVADAIARGVGPAKPVRVVPHPHPGLEDVVPDRAQFGLPADAFMFLAMYDVRSSAARKNPMGAIKAFQAAFGPDRRDVLLALKVVNAQESRGCLEGIRRAVEGWPNIRILTGQVSDAAANSLLAGTDVFVSLHRAEGFGLSIAQAMALGRAVIATAWSGNLDFCDQGVALVPAALVPAEDESHVYYEGEGQLWADPDLGFAAAEMRRLADDPAAARALGEAARAHLATRLPTTYPTDHLKPWLAP